MTLEPFRGRSLITWLDYEAPEIRVLLDLSKQVKEESRAAARGTAAMRPQRFAGKTIALLFEKRSTRTRCAFETAFGEEGGHPVFLSTQDIQLGAKESIEDTARVLGRMFSAIQFRGFKQSTVETLARYSGVPVFNGLTDSYHPTQALADIMTLEESFGDSRGKRICFVGDGRNNVARSLMVICAKLGVNFTVICPPSLAPDPALLALCLPLARAAGAALEVTPDLAAVAGAEALYTDVWVSMGEEALREERVALLRAYQVNEALMERTGRADSIFLHCLPAVKGEEVSAAVIDGPRSRAWDEAENRKHTIKAIMLAAINGEA
ncbi:MAG: ornithine carbamoyltransferase [Spirochaetaceae bacterium]|jgi:ornithine carbamoyltransferase|nr:ornithine carbamoyltransferase [Spirochaetaceae bacterium]